jgi:hypothetical protein
MNTQATNTERSKPSRRFRRVVASLVAAVSVIGATRIAPAPAATPNSTRQANLIATATGPRDVLVNGSYVYWTNSSNQSIGRANLDGSGVNQNFIAVSGIPSGLATAGGQLYWTNLINYTDGGSTIGRANLDGTGTINSSFITGASAPTGIATDATYVYWVSYTNGNISRAKLDGTAVQPNFIPSVVGHNGTYGLAVSATSIYWTNFGGIDPANPGTTIGRANIDGTAATSNFIIGLPTPTGIAVDSNYLYWSNYDSNGANNNSVSRATLNPAGAVTSVISNYLSGLSVPTGIDFNSTFLYWGQIGNAIAAPSFLGRTMLDNSAPVITADNVTATATTLAGATVSYSASASDVDDAVADVSLVCSQLSGTPFALGVTTVNCTATDPIGNASTKSFTVTVTLPPAPVLTVPANFSTFATSLSGTDVSYSGVSSTVGTPLCTPATGTKFPLGSTTVNCAVTDTFERTVTGMFTVTVVKPGFPTLSAVANQTVTATSPAGAAVTYVLPIASAGTPSCLPASGSVFPIGSTTVSCKTTDAVEQTTTSTFMVTVVKPAASAFVTPANQTVAAETANGSKINYVLPTSPTATIVCTPASGSLFPVGDTTVSCTGTDAYSQTTTRTFNVKVLAFVPTVVPLVVNSGGGAVMAPVVAGVPLAPTPTVVTTTVAPTTVAPTTVAPTTTAPAATTTTVAKPVETTTIPTTSKVAVVLGESVDAPTEVPVAPTATPMEGTITFAG